MFRRDFFRTLLGGALALVGLRSKPAPRYLPMGKAFVPEPCGIVYHFTTYKGFPMVIEESRLTPPG